MKSALLSIVCLSTTLLLSLTTLAQDQPSPKKHELHQAPVLKPWTGDLDGMVKRRVIRALVAPSRTSYWLVGIRQTGAEYELLKAFENEINEHYKTQGKHIRIHVVFIPTSRDQLNPGLLEGRGDIAVGILTVTPDCLEKVDFGEQFFRGVKEIAVTGPASPELSSADDLSGKEVFVRKSSSFWTHLEDLNERFTKEHKARSHSKLHRKICRTTISWKCSMQDSSGLSLSIVTRRCSGRKCSRR
jgi:membrane-bound lytic murein transglycosylase MltF